MPSELHCLNPECRAVYPIDEVIYTCPRCAALLEAGDRSLALDPAETKRRWRERRMSNAPLDQSGVWRYREMLGFFDERQHCAVTCARATRRR